MLSPFADGQRRASADLGARRNQFVAALASAIVAVYAEPGGMTARTIAEAISWGRPVTMLDSPDHGGRAAAGARPLAVRAVAPWWDALRRGMSASQD